jgi:hypothetical protein
MNLTVTLYPNDVYPTFHGGWGWILFGYFLDIVPEIYIHLMLQGFTSL